MQAGLVLLMVTNGAMAQHVIDVGGGTGLTIFKQGAANNVHIVPAPAAQDLVFSTLNAGTTTNSTERIRIKYGTGRVIVGGVGYPRATLTVQGDYYGTGALMLTPAVGETRAHAAAVIQGRNLTYGGTNVDLQFKTQLNGNPVDVMYLGANTLVGIGTNAPTHKLHVNGDIRARFASVDAVMLTDVATNTTLGFGTGFEGNGNVAIGRKAGHGGLPFANHSVFIGYNSGIDFSNVTFENNQNPLTSGKSVFVVNNQAQLHNPLLFGTFVDNTNKEDPASHTVNGSMAQLAINTHHLVDSCALTIAGAVHVGPKDLNPTSFPKDSLYQHYLLWVERGIVTEDLAMVKVASWSDFVFDETYNLPELAEVEKFVKDNKHLPGVPSEAKVKAEGYTVHQMNKILLQKVEELTLYTIRQQKEIDEQQKQLELLKALAAEVAALKDKINK